MEENILFAISKLLDSKLSQDKEYLDVSEAAIFLGISKDTLYKKNYRKEIPYFKPNGSKKIYYHRDVLIAYITQNKILSKQELEEKAKNFLKPKK